MSLQILMLVTGCGLYEYEGSADSGLTERTTATTSGSETCQGDIFTGPTSLGSAAVSCTEGSLRMDGETVGWASGGFLILQDSSGRIEEHGVDDTMFDNCGYWCLIEREVSTGANPTDWTPNSSTAVTCDDQLTWAVGVNDLDGNLVDCQVFGAHPQRLLDSGVVSLSSCPQLTVAAGG